MLSMIRVMNGVENQHFRSEQRYGTSNADLFDDGNGARPLGHPPPPPPPPHRVVYIH